MVLPEKRTAKKMPGNSFGQSFRITTFGESHGPALGVVIDGCPPLLDLSEDDIQPEMDRRRPGQSAVTTARKEDDVVHILSGVFEGKTTGMPIAIVIHNEDQRSRDYSDIKDKFRPGHADFTYLAKYGIRDYRGGGRASARETVARVAAGAVAKKLLSADGVGVLGYTVQVGVICMPEMGAADITLETIEANPVRCPDQPTALRMEELMARVRKEGDSVGGAAVITAVGCPAGLGEPVFDKLKADLAKALLSVPAVVGFEYGVGFKAAGMRGIEFNDSFLVEDGVLSTRDNRAGGILGGISTGEMLNMRVALKPTSSIPTEQNTIDVNSEPTTIKTKGRHDPCLVPRFIPIGEAMVALVLADHLLRWRQIR